MEGKKIGKRCQSISVRAGGAKRPQTRSGALGFPQSAFTLVELLVVISIVSVLMGILLPALNGVKRQAVALTGMRNQREVATSVNLFAADNGDLYPPSVATLGVQSDWHWYDPTVLIGKEKRSPQMHRAMSAYLHPYISDAKTVFCPSAPKQYQYLQESWDAGDAWDNPDNELHLDPVDGTYCFFWNYIGLPRRTPPVVPRAPRPGQRRSDQPTTDHRLLRLRPLADTGLVRQLREAAGGDILPEQWLESAWWRATGDPDATPQVKLRAAYTDGHVQTYYPTRSRRCGSP